MILEQLRSLVLLCLKVRLDAHWEWNVQKMWGMVAGLAKEQDLDYKPNEKAWYNEQGSDQIHGQLLTPVSDILWDLLVEGVIRPGLEGSDEFIGWPHFHVTPYGRVAVNEPATPHDPDNYLKQLTELVPNIDRIIFKYMAESAQTFRRGCYLSSTFMLGCACEKAFVLLREALSNALNPTDKAKYDTAMKKDWRIKKQHAVFMQWYQRDVVPRLAQTGMNSDWQTQLDSALNFVLDYF